LGKRAEKTRRISSKKGPKVAENGAFPGSKPPFRRAARRRPWIASRYAAIAYVCELRPLPGASGPTGRHFLDFGFQFSVFSFRISVVLVRPWRAVVRCPLSVAGIAPALACRCPWSFVRGPLSLVPCPLSIAGIAPASAGRCHRSPLSLVRCSLRAGPGGRCPWSVARVAVGRGWPTMQFFCNGPRTTD
jgi:hypothetical protein